MPPGSRGHLKRRGSSASAPGRLVRGRGNSHSGGRGNSHSGLQDSHPSGLGGGSLQSVPHRVPHDSHPSGGGGGSVPQSGRGGGGSVPQTPQSVPQTPQDSHHSGRVRDSLQSVRHDSSPSSHGHETPISVRRTQSGHVRHLSDVEARNIGSGYAGSNSGRGESDPAADMAGVFRHHRRVGNTLDQEDVFTADERDSVVDDTPPLPGDRPFVTQIGTKFVKGKVHRRIRRIFDNFFAGAWPTFKSIPLDVIDEMYKTFGTYYQWNPADNGTIRSAFEHVLATRHSDVMSTYRKQSARLARSAGHRDVTNRDFSVIRNYPPDLLCVEQWQKLCDEHWNTPLWLKNSDVAKANRASSDKSGKVSRHTGGSMGNDEHRLKLEKKLGAVPTLEQLYCDTHLLKEDKEKYWAGDYDDIEGLDFCTSTAKEVLVAYKKGMCEKYGEDQSQHPGDDSDVFVRAQEGRGPGWRIYGIGNSDLDFVVTGRSSQSSQGGSSVTSAD